MSLSAVAPMEILRRLLALACLLVGGYLFFWPGTPLLVVSLADLRQDFEHRITTTKEDLADPQAFADFVAYRTEGRTRPVQGEQWRELADRLAAPDQDSSTDLAARKLDSGATPRYLFRPSEPPFGAAAPYRDFQYLRLDQDTLLAVSLQPPQEILGLTGDYAHPLRTTGLILAAAGLLAYALLPRRRPGPGELRYGRFASVIGADLLGLVFAVGFAILPLLVVWENNPGGSVFSGLAVPGRAPVVHGRAGRGAAERGRALRRSGLAHRPGRPDPRHGRTETLFPWADIEKAEPYRTRIGPESWAPCS